MKKKLGALLLALTLCLSLCVPAMAAGATVTGTYANGVVTVNGSGFDANVKYSMISIMDGTTLLALGSATADPDGAFTVSITTGAITSLTNCTVYVYADNGGAVVAPGDVTGTGGGITTYLLTVNGSTATNSGAGSYAADTSVPINAGTKSGYTFAGWTATGGGSFANASLATTTYTMPAGAATITANWNANGGGGGGGDGGGGSTKPPSTSGDNGVKVDVPSSGNMSDAAIDSALKTAGTAKDEIILSNPRSDAPVSLSGASTQKLADAGKSLVVETKTASVTLDNDVLGELASLGGEVKLTVKPVGVKSLTVAEQDKIGVSTVVLDLALTAGGTAVTDFAGGTAAVTVAYKLPAEQSAEFVVIWFMDDAGKISPVSTSMNAKTGLLTFETGHFSKYVVGYLPFTDVSAGAYYEGIVYAFNHQTFGGVGNDKFAPYNNMTRAMLWTVLYRQSGSDVKGTGDLWYADAMAWAVGTGISDGSNPNGNITREQLAAILYRYAGTRGMDTGINASLLEVFADNATVSAFARDAMAWAVGKGIITGTADNLLNPRGNATRAQVATMLMRFVSVAEDEHRRAHHTNQIGEAAQLRRLP